MLRPEHHHGLASALGLAETLVHPRLSHESQHVRHANAHGERRRGSFREAPHVSHVRVGGTTDELRYTSEVSGADGSVGGVVGGGNEGIELPVGPDPIDHHLFGVAKKEHAVAEK